MDKEDKAIILRLIAMLILFALYWILIINYKII